MLRSAERKRRGWRAAAVAGVTVALLTAIPAGAEESGELQLGGFMTRIHSLPGLAEGPSGVPVDPGGTETGAGDNTVYPMQFAPPSVVRRMVLPELTTTPVRALAKATEFKLASIGEAI